MPIYEYLCERCGQVTEVMQKIGDRPPSACPECGSKRLAKLVSRAAFQLKGGGWYADLYGSPGKKGAGKESGKEPGSGAPPGPAAPAEGPKKAAGEDGRKGTGKDGGKKAPGKGG